MGNYSLILALAGVVIISTLVFNSRQATTGADTEVTRHTYKTLAREASVTGLNMTVRKLVADTSSWNAKLTADPAAYSFTDAEYRNNTTFTTRVFSSTRGYGAGEVAGTCYIDTVDVVSTGYSAPYEKSGDSYEMDRRTATHKVEATYVRTCSDTGGSDPPDWSKYVTVSDMRFDIDGEIRVYSSDITQNASVHSNTRLYVTNPAIVEGYGSQTMSTGGGCSDPCDTIFLPNDDTNGGASNFLRGQPEVEIPFFDYTKYEPLATHRDGTVEINSNITIDFTNYQGITGYGTKENPALWFIDGDLLINADYLQIIGYVRIVVKDGVKINGDASLITGVPAGEFPPESTYDNPNKAAVRSWLAEHMPEGTTMGLYAAGCYDSDCGNPGIHIDGNNVTVGQMFANNTVFINGDATTFGAIATRSTMRYNAKNVLWYTDASEAIYFDTGGGGSQLPDGIQMLAFVEF